MNASNYYSLDDTKCYLITPWEQPITAAFVLTLCCFALVLWDFGTFVRNKFKESLHKCCKCIDKKEDRSPFGDGTLAVRFTVLCVSILIEFSLFIMILFPKEDEALTGEGKYVFKYSGCEKYDNVSSDTQGFFTTSFVLSIVNIVVFFLVN